MRDKIDAIWRDSVEMLVLAAAVTLFSKLAIMAVMEMGLPEAILFLVVLVGGTATCAYFRMKE